MTSLAGSAQDDGVVVAIYCKRFRQLAISLQAVNTQIVGIPTNRTKKEKYGPNL
jgi:hypothetical protein